MEEVLDELRSGRRPLGFISPFVCPMTKIRTGGSFIRPVSIPLSQWSYQRKSGRGRFWLRPEVDFAKLGRLRHDVVRPGPMMSFCDWRISFVAAWATMPAKFSGVPTCSSSYQPER